MPDPKPKPNIQRLWTAVNAYQNKTRFVMRQSPATWKEGFSEARNAFKGQMEALGIADAFDWTDESGK